MNMYKCVPMINNTVDKWIEAYIDNDFHGHFRMTRSTFTKLVSMFRQDAQMDVSYTGGHEPLSIEKKLLITLWYLAKEGAMFTTGEFFNIAKSTVKKAVDLVVNQLCKFSSKIIVWPKKSDCVEIAKVFHEKSKFPGVIGAIDGCHFTVKPPADQQDSYTDRKLNKSILMQGICTSNKIFTNVNVGFPGRLHDARVFVNSQVYIKVDEEGQEELFYSNIYHLLGDSAYPNLSWLIVPYKDYGNLNSRQRQFNYTLSKARVCKEHAFGLLKGRWRRLLYINTTNMKKASKIILACCVLHNFCLLNDDYLDVVVENILKVNESQEHTRNRFEILTGDVKRNEILRLLNI
ncbi:protein ALP1-like isoform X2 [Myzus persicae]|uniref:protein ALP1-like isoform X2 n=1 Tax=Myzus persicae TaxID=13164 RepID=UPI000B936128|nr:protein ALP1-like isoform X2 [Myzus persicae]